MNKKVAVAGAGVLGAQIAVQVAYCGYDVCVYEVEVGLERALDLLSHFQDLYRSRLATLRVNPNAYWGGICPDANPTAEELDALEARLEDGFARMRVTTVAEEAFADADYVIEAIPELAELKVDFYTMIAPMLPEQAILMTNTSTYKPSTFAACTGRPERYLVLHFMNSIWSANMVEVSAHQGGEGFAPTDPAVVDETVAFAKSINMRPVVLNKEHTTHIYNSMLTPLLTAAMELYAGGVADKEDIDYVWGLGHNYRTGPMRSIDTIGLNTFHNILIQNPRAYEPGDALCRGREILEGMIAEGKLGMNAGVGFYDYSQPPAPERTFSLGAGGNHQKVTVAGGGVLGAQIAVQIAYMGYDVCVYEVEAGLERAREMLRHFHDAYAPKFERRRKDPSLRWDGIFPGNDPTPEEIDEAEARFKEGWANLTLTTSPEEAFTDAAYVIESIPEVPEIKIGFYRLIAPLLGEKTILMTNSSTYPSSMFAAYTGCAERYLNFHFMNAIWSSNMVEIAAHPAGDGFAATDPAVVEEAYAFAESINMRPIVLKKEKPSLIYNSLFEGIVAAAVEMYVDGVADFETIDYAWTLGSPRLAGPFRSIDSVGLNTFYNCYVKDERVWEPGTLQWRVREFLEGMIAEGKLGYNAGQGFYAYR